MGKRISKETELWFIATTEGEDEYDDVNVIVARPSMLTTNGEGSTWLPKPGAYIPKGLRPWSYYERLRWLDGYELRWKVLAVFHQHSAEALLLEFLHSLESAEVKVENTSFRDALRCFLENLISQIH